VNDIRLPRMWLARIRDGRVGWVKVDGMTAHQRGDRVRLVVADQGGANEMALVEITDVTTITDDYDDGREIIVCTIVSVKLVD